MGSGGSVPKFGRRDDITLPSIEQTYLNEKVPSNCVPFLFGDNAITGGYGYLKGDLVYHQSFSFLKERFERKGK